MHSMHKLYQIISQVLISSHIIPIARKTVPNSGVSHLFISGMFQMKPVACFQQQFFVVTWNIYAALLMVCVGSSEVK